MILRCLRPVGSLRNYRRRRRRSCNPHGVLWKCAFLCFVLLFACHEVTAQQQQQQQQQQVTAREQDDGREKNHKNETLCWKKAQQHWQSSSSLFRRGKTKRPILPSWTQSKDAEKAYRMAALSGLAYWNFHRRVMPRATTSFQLVQDDDEDDTDRSSRMIRRPATRLIKAVQRQTLIFLCQTSRTLESSTPSILREQFVDSIRQQKDTCLDQILLQQAAKQNANAFTFAWSLYDWHEPTPVGARWHDTDVLISTSCNDSKNKNQALVISFAGTASAADHFTNVQTFEPVQHSGIFSSVGNNNNNNTTISGSIHRGFLNAYSRVEHGHVIRIDPHSHPLTASLVQRYRHCYPEQTATHYGTASSHDDSMIHPNSTSTNTTSNGNGTWNESSSSSPNNNKDRNSKRKPPCRSRGEKLQVLLQTLALDALQQGYTVHITGHSLGGGLATIMALDLILNFPRVSMDRLHLWTFGAPVVADETFWQSALSLSRRLQDFFPSSSSSGSRRRRRRTNRNRCHRYVTLSDTCEADVVSSIVSKALPSHRKGLHGFLARRLGGVRGSVVHFAEPHYLLPLSFSDELLQENHDDNDDERRTTMTTSSVIGTHQINSYLHGISRESRNHPLQTNLPLEVSDFLGERLSSSSSSSVQMEQPDENDDTDDSDDKSDNKSINLNKDGSNDNEIPPVNKN